MNVLNQAMLDLTVREFGRIIFDVARPSSGWKWSCASPRDRPYIIELGTEGRLIEMQMEELMLPVKEAELNQDYFQTPERYAKPSASG